MKQIFKEIKTHAKANPNIEICGLVIKRFKDRGLEYVACENISPQPHLDFRVKPRDLITASNKGKILYLVHSHINGNNELSKNDVLCQRASGLDFLLVVNNEIKMFKYYPPLLGRPYEHMKKDCRTLIIDAYHIAKVQLPTKETYSKEWYKTADLYTNGLLAYGFVKVDKLQVGDIILFNLGGLYPNHAGIYTGIQGAELLHHQIERLSNCEPINSYLHQRINSMWRYNGEQELKFNLVIDELKKELLC